MEFWKSISGMLTVEFTSACPEEVLETVTQAKIPLSHVVRKTELTYQMRILRKDFRRLSRILHSRGNQLKIIRKGGLYWPLKGFLRRPVLLVLFFLILVSSLYLPSRILFITVDGNTRIPDRLILSAAEDCGIRFGASRKTLRSEKVKNALLSAVPQLQWAGINTSGCTAVISVRERGEEPAEDTHVVSNIIADLDGYILSATVTGGTARCAPGDAVTRGQVLVSGYTDCGICIRASRAEGEILAQTSRKQRVVMPEKHLLPEYIGEPYYGIGLLIGKKRINLWKDSRISEGSCGRMYEEYYVSLPGGYRLPVALCVDRYRSFAFTEAAVPEAEILQKLQQFSEEYLLRQTVAGRILRRQHQLTRSGNLYLLESSYICTEMIGKEQREQIGDINGKRN